MLRRKSILSILLIVLALPILAQTQQTNIAIILDGSGSMQAFLPSGERKLDAAKEAFEVLVQTLPTETNASFWSYGHRLPQDDVTASCNDIEEILPLQPINAQSFISAAQNLDAIGYTPISQSLTLAAQTLPVSVDANNIIVLVSDGEETCAGDPCAVAQQLAASNVDLKVNTIGFDVDAVTRAQLQCIADVTGGRYFDAADAAGLQTAVVEASQVEVATPTPTATPQPTDGAILFVDGNDEAIVVGYTITQAESGMVVAESSGTRVSIEQGIYNVEYRSTTSPVITLTETATILGGDEVKLVMPRNGSVKFVNSLGEQTNVNYSIVNTITGEEITGGPWFYQDLQPGEYEVTYQLHERAESFTTSVSIAEGEEVLLSVIGDGGIKFVDSFGEQVNVYFAVVDTATGQEVASEHWYHQTLQPGEYEVTYRVNEGDEPIVNTVTIVEGEEVLLSVVANGNILFVDSAGNQISVDYTIVDVATGQEIVSERWYRHELQPGEYEVTYQLDEQSEANTATVTIVEGEEVLLSVVANGNILFVDSAGNQISVDYTIVDVATGQEIVSERWYRHELQPGEYEVTYQLDEQSEANTATVTIVEGEEVLLSVVANGNILFVDSAGNQLSVNYTIVDAATGQEIANERWYRHELQPGEYEVTYQLDEQSETNTATVTIVEGEEVLLSVVANGNILFVDSAGNQLSVNYTIVDAATGQEIANERWYRHELQPGEYEVTYQLDEQSETNTATVTIVEGEEVLLSVVANGNILFVDSAGNQLSVNYTIVDAATGQEIANERWYRHELQPGEYEVTYQLDEQSETNTATVTIVEGEEVLLSVVANGNILFVDSAGNQLSVYYTVVDTALGQELANERWYRHELQPGEYEVTYRVNESDEPISSTVTIVEGEEVLLSVVANGEILFVDSAGDNLSVVFTIVDTSRSKEVASQRWFSQDLQPNVYRVTVSAYDDSVMGELLVFVEENQVTTITVSKSGEITSDRPATEADIVLLPTPTLMPAPEADEDGFVRQWASEASGSSQYGDDNWSFQQATGAPDTDGCGDIPTAWASSSSTGQDFLTLVYDTPVFVQQIDIYQTLNPGSIVSVDISTPEGQTMTLGNSTDAPGNTECPGVFSVQVSGIDFPPINTVTINLDQTIGGSWNEIDAVELIGTLNATSSTVSDESTTTTDSTVGVDTASADGASFLLTLSNGDIYNQTQAQVEILEISFQDTVQFAIRKSLLEPIVTIDIKERLASGTYTISDETDASVTSIAIPFEVDGIPYSAIYGTNLVGQFSITNDGGLATGAFQIEADRNLTLNMNDFSIADVVDGAPELPERINASGLFSNVPVPVELQNG